MTVQAFQFVADTTVRRRGGWRVALILLAVAFALRSAQFGNAINGLDEQYYLLVGDRMWAGALPYVDLWDRKPFGLFALFAGIRLLGGDGVVQAQVVATLCAAATGAIVYRIALRSVPYTPALLAGIFYLVALQMLWGGTTQTPVFYNLPVAAAVLLVLDRPRDFTRGGAAMLLCGLAIQLKTNAVFEGGALGLWLLWQLRDEPAKVLRRAVAFALIGLAPTLAVALGYAAIGHFDAWWFANFRSLFLKHSDTAAGLIRLQETAGLTLPLLLIAGMGLFLATEKFRKMPQMTALFALWSGFALLDALAIGGFWPHYVLPFALPAAILAAHAFAAPRWGVIGFVVLSAWPVFDAVVLDRFTAADERRITTATLAAIPGDAATRCLFIYEGPVAYYQRTHACLVTRFAFTDHLRSSAEADALGEDASTALRAALARHPATILTLDGSLWTERNRANDRILAATLARDYVRVARLPHRHYSVGREWLLVWRRRDLPRAGNLVRKLSNSAAYHSSATIGIKSA